MNMDLKSMAVEMPEVRGHPNRVAFQGVLTMVDVPSQRAPSGAKGHCVVLTRRAAEAALPSLLGMGVDYSPTLDKHDVRCKVGVITRAEIVGRNLELGGYLFAKDFPEIVEEVEKSGGIAGRGAGERQWKRVTIASGLEGRAQSRSLYAVASDCGRKQSSADKSFSSSLRNVAGQLLKITEKLRNREKGKEIGETTIIRAQTPMGSGSRGLGMSYEVTDIRLGNARGEIWVLDEVTFTGAAILRRDKAAYQDTWIQLT